MSKRTGKNTEDAGPKFTFPITTDELHGFVNDREEGLNAARENGAQQGLARQLNVDLRHGRSDTKELEAARLEAFGANELPPPDEVTFMDGVWESLEDPMMRLLIGAAVISLILGLTVPDRTTGLVDYAVGWVEGTAILVSVVLVTIVTAVNNYQKEQKFRELSDAAPPQQVLVTRHGKVSEIPDTQLLVGDLVHVKEGQVMPADAMLIITNGIRADESGATGENEEIEKSVDGDFMLKSGSNIVEGEGIAMVTGVGVNSFAGKINMEVREKKKDTPLQEQLDDLANAIGNLGMGAAVLMFVALSIKECLNIFYYETNPFMYQKFLDMITTSITIVVVAVPEGLPLSVTIALAYSMKQMFSENNLVRHLAACETMGSATTICTDKTGTLTQNLMTVMSGFLAHKEFTLAATSSHPSAIAAHEEAEIDRVMPRSSVLSQLFAESISLNSSATKKRVPAGPSAGGAAGKKKGAKKGSAAEEEEMVTKFVGNKTECAMLNFCEKAGHDPILIRGRVDPADINAFPFTSARKRMTTVVRQGTHSLRWHVKGASELVVEDCDFIHCGSYVEPLTRETRASINKTILEMARNRLRTIAVAYVDQKVAEGSAAGKGPNGFPTSDESMPRLTLLGILGIEDPIRPEVPEAVETCKRAGVSILMVTGDNKATAISIAKKAGIYGTLYSGPLKGEQGLAMDAKLFREYASDPAKLDIILPRLQVLARANPTDKRILVSALMERGEVVAVTGDGTNDAPALKSANVGFAMNTGTEVAKSASDVVILDDNFRSIVTAMKWGRNVHDNISKFIQFQTTVNVAAVSIAFIGACISGNSESPLKPVQLLWLNLIMDTMAALALATESPSMAVLDRNPRGRDAPLISRRMWVNILGQAAYQIFLQLWVLNFGYRFFGVEHESKEHLTIVFNIFVLLQVVNEFNARILDQTLNVFSGLARAPMFLLIILVTILVQVGGVTYAGVFMHTVPLSLDQWKRCCFFSIAPLFIGFFLRMIPVSEPATTLKDFVRRDEDGNSIPEQEEAERLAALKHKKPRRMIREDGTPKLTFQRAGYSVIAQLKAVGALAELVAVNKFDE